MAIERIVTPQFSPNQGTRFEFSGNGHDLWRLPRAGSKPERPQKAGQRYRNEYRDVEIEKLAVQRALMVLLEHMRLSIGETAGVGV
jgi:hypothetical protein